MKTKRPWAKLGLITAAAVALSAAVLVTACGKLKSDGVPSAGEQSLTLDVVNATKGSDGRYSVRANGKDTIEIVATVRGLSSYVGFYIPATWGTFIGGVASATDGFTYYSADSDGKARAILVAGITKMSDAPTSTATQNATQVSIENPTGRIELVAKSLTVEQSLPLSFDFAGLQLFPSILKITDWSVPIYIYARGGLPPIEWFVSDPRAVKYNVINDNTVAVYVTDPSVFPSGGSQLIVYARDAEGQVATSLVTLGGSVCAASTITADPASPKSSTSATAITISVLVVDSSQAEAESVIVRVGGAGSGSMTLTQWSTPGVFQGSYTIPAMTAASTNYIFQYAGVDNACQPTLIKDDVTTS